MANNRQQTKALNRVCKRRAFKQCYCGSWNTFQAYEPGWIGWTVWCYVCGRKDEEVLRRPLLDDEQVDTREVKVPITEQEFKVYLKGLTPRQRLDLLLQLKAKG